MCFGNIVACAGGQMVPASGHAATAGWCPVPKVWEQCPPLMYVEVMQAASPSKGLRLQP